MSIARARTVFSTLAPTSRTAATGVPVARGINFAAKGASAGHDDHGDASVRTDFDVPKWAGSNGVGFTGLVSRTRMTGQSASPSSPSVPPARSLRTRPAEAFFIRCWPRGSEQFRRRRRACSVTGAGGEI